MLSSGHGARPLDENKEKVTSTTVTLNPLLRPRCLGVVLLVLPPGVVAALVLREKIHRHPGACGVGFGDNWYLSDTRRRERLGRLLRSPKKLRVLVIKLSTLIPTTYLHVDRKAKRHSSHAASFASQSCETSSTNPCTTTSRRKRPKDRARHGNGPQL